LEPFYYNEITNRERFRGEGERKKGVERARPWGKPQLSLLHVQQGARGGSRWRLGKPRKGRRRHRGGIFRNAKSKLVFSKKVGRKKGMKSLGGKS